MAALAYNAAVFTVYAFDKQKARRGQRRIPEATLLWLALLGGGGGAMLGMRLAHHKTRKPAFAWGIPLMLAGQIALFLWATGRI